MRKHLGIYVQLLLGQLGRVITSKLLMMAVHWVVYMMLLCSIDCRLLRRAHPLELVKHLHITGFIFQLHHHTFKLSILELSSTSRCNFSSAPSSTIHSYSANSL